MRFSAPWLAGLLLLAACNPFQEGRDISRRILPGQALATFIPGSPAGATPLSEVTVTLAQPATQGRLRFRLVDAVQRNGKATPGTTDLLPHAAQFAPPQLRQEGDLTLPLKDYHITLPPQGLFLVVECEPTTPGEKRLAITVAGRGTDDPKTSVVLSGDPANPQASQHVLPASDFPGLLAQYGGRSTSMTYLQADSAGAWMMKGVPCTVRVESKLAVN